MIKRALEVTSAVALGISFVVVATSFFAAPVLLLGALAFFAIVSTTF